MNVISEEISVGIFMGVADTVAFRVAFIDVLFWVAVTVALFNSERKGRVNWTSESITRWTSRTRQVEKK